MVSNSSTNKYIEKFIPSQFLSSFKNKDSEKLYHQFLVEFIKEILSNGTSLPQALAAERSAYYATCLRVKENAKDFMVDEDYRFFTSEFNKSVGALNKLTIDNLSEIQMENIAKRTIRIIEKLIESPTLKRRLVEKLMSEFDVKPAGIRIV